MFARIALLAVALGVSSVALAQEGRYSGAVTGSVAASSVAESESAVQHEYHYDLWIRSAYVPNSQWFRVGSYFSRGEVVAAARYYAAHGYWTHIQVHHE